MHLSATISSLRVRLTNLFVGRERRPGSVAGASVARREPIAAGIVAIRSRDDLEILGLIHDGSSSERRCDDLDFLSMSLMDATAMSRRHRLGALSLSG